MSDKERQLTDAVAQIYRAAVEPSLWADALSSCADILGAHISTMFVWDSYEDKLYGELQTGADDALFQEYVTHYSADCPWMAKIPWVQTHGRVTLGPEVIPQADFLKTASFHELYKKMDVTDNCVVPIMTGRFFGLSTFLAGGAKGAYDERDRELALIIQRHLKEAIALSTALGVKHGQAILSALGFPAALIGANGKIVRANRNFDQLLRDALFVRESLGAVDFVDRNASSAFRKWLVGDRRFPAMIPYRHGGGVRFAKAVSLPAGDHHPFAQSAERSCLLGFPAEARLDMAALDALRGIGLTAAEALLVEAYAAEPSVAKVAIVLGWTEQTTRWRLKQVFAKLNVSSQPALAALLARLSPPIAGDETP